MQKIPTLEVSSVGSFQADGEPDPSPEPSTPHPHRLSHIFKRHKIIEDLENIPDDLGLVPHSSVDQRRVRTKVIKKPHRDFHNLRHVQKLEVPVNADANAPQSQAPIWSIAISPDGIYMAAAGAGKVVWVWTVLYHHEGEAKGGHVFAAKPIRVFQGHTDEIQQLAWSSNNFLVTASLDHTAKLWHVERENCLATFHHPDMVSSVKFHPTDDRFFLTGCLDSTVRLWSIPDREVAHDIVGPSRISTVAFGPKGGLCFAGCFDGQVLIINTADMKLRKTLQVGSPHGFNSNTGSEPLRVTGLTVFIDEDEAVSRVKILVSSNGSRLRIYDLQTLDLDCKYRGFTNQYSQASASISPDKHWIIAPSEDRRTYIWARSDMSTSLLKKSTKNASVEYFKSNRGIVTCAMFLPNETKDLLGYSGDIIVTADIEGDIRLYHNVTKSPHSGAPHLFGRGLIRSFSMHRKHTKEAAEEE